MRRLLAPGIAVLLCISALLLLRAGMALAQGAAPAAPAGSEGSESRASSPPPRSRERPHAHRVGQDEQQEDEVRRHDIAAPPACSTPRAGTGTRAGRRGAPRRRAECTSDRAECTTIAFPWVSEAAIRDR